MAPLKDSTTSPVHQYVKLQHFLLTLFPKSSLQYGWSVLQRGLNSFSPCGFVMCRTNSIIYIKKNVIILINSEITYYLLFIVKYIYLLFFYNGLFFLYQSISFK